MLAWRIDGTEFGDSAAAMYVANNAWSAQVNFTCRGQAPAKAGIA
ncbi:MAG TPA: hypothetical protein VGC21_14895 [Telluria sp.]|jgi:glycogen operon protein